MTPRAQMRLGAWVERELVVDLFAGGGGTSEGIAQALGRHPDIAINHDPEAVAMHTANHPTTTHYCESVFKVAPRDAVGGRPVGLLWLSPDCTHHSKAKGGKPRNKKIRGLAWVACRWAHDVKPRVICLENVEEWADWGPLDEDNQPIEAAKGRTFRAFCAKLRRYGYVVEHRILVAADYGSPTTRKRLFLIARRDGRPIVWPEPTHGKGRARPWRTAAEIIDWTLPVPSIFGRPKPLAGPTLRRIAVGLRRYAIECARPFVAPTAALMVPTLIQTGYGEREGQAPRVLDLHKPLGTVVAGGAKHALVVAFLTKHYGGVVGHGLERPLGTVTTQDHHALTVARLGPGPRAAESLALFAAHSPGPSIVRVNGEDRAIGDVGMRMLAPRELFRAQGFGDHYIIDPIIGGKPMTKTAQYGRVGNSVAVQMAEAIVRANLGASLRAEAA
jgi:DNA (cytosine-5)-methyltransferase 1